MKNKLKLSRNSMEEPRPLQWQPDRELVAWSLLQIVPALLCHFSLSSALLSSFQLRIPAPYASEAGAVGTALRPAARMSSAVGRSDCWKTRPQPWAMNDCTGFEQGLAADAACGWGMLWFTETERAGGLNPAPVGGGGQKLAVFWLEWLSSAANDPVRCGWSLKISYLSLTSEEWQHQCLCSSRAVVHYSASLSRTALMCVA